MDLNKAALCGRLQPIGLGQAPGISPGVLEVRHRLCPEKKENAYLTGLSASGPLCWSEPGMGPLRAQDNLDPSSPVPSETATATNLPSWLPTTNLPTLGCQKTLSKMQIAQVLIGLKFLSWSKLLSVAPTPQLCPPPSPWNVVLIRVTLKLHPCGPGRGSLAAKC